MKENVSSTANEAACPAPSHTRGILKNRDDRIYIDEEKLKKMERDGAAADESCRSRGSSCSTDSCSIPVCSDSDVETARNERQRHLESRLSSARMDDGSLSENGREKTCSGKKKVRYKSPIEGCRLEEGQSTSSLSTSTFGGGHSLPMYLLLLLALSSFIFFACTNGIGGGNLVSGAAHTEVVPLSFIAVGIVGMAVLLTYLSLLESLHSILLVDTIFVSLLVALYLWGCSILFTVIQIVFLILAAIGLIRPVKSLRGLRMERAYHCLSHISLDSFFFCCNTRLMAHIPGKDVLLLLLGLLVFQVLLLVLTGLARLSPHARGRFRLANFPVAGPRSLLLTQAAFLLHVAVARNLSDSYLFTADLTVLALYFILRAWRAPLCNGWKKMLSEILTLTGTVCLMVLGLLLTDRLLSGELGALSQVIATKAAASREEADATETFNTGIKNKENLINTPRRYNTAPRRRKPHDNKEPNEIHLLLLP
jgi:hypothetical protein